MRVKWGEGEHEIVSDVIWHIFFTSPGHDIAARICMCFMCFLNKIIKKQEIIKINLFIYLSAFATAIAVVVIHSILLCNQKLVPLLLLPKCVSFTLLL